MEFEPHKRRQMGTDEDEETNADELDRGDSDVLVISTQHLLQLLRPQLLIRRTKNSQPITFIPFIPSLLLIE